MPAPVPLTAVAPAPPMVLPVQRIPATPAVPDLISGLVSPVRRAEPQLAPVVAYPYRSGGGGAGGGGTGGGGTGGSGGNGGGGQYDPPPPYSQHSQHSQYGPSSGHVAGHPSGHASGHAVGHGSGHASGQVPGQASHHASGQGGGRGPGDSASVTSLFDPRKLKDAQVDELTHKLIGPLTRMLRTELRLDRERIGRLRDPRR
ncbi:hypothetical protein [Streptacidiphilus cavernicola]|uniref:Extensin n=1 Tax=Streptacidiphilus cavernicola TaxID=3342716 RepID=A0ABV6VWS2_9ACTN